METMILCCLSVPLHGSIEIVWNTIENIFAYLVSKLTQIQRKVEGIHDNSVAKSSIVRNAFFILGGISLSSQFYLEILTYIPWYHGEGNGNPLQYSCLEYPMDGEAWWAAVHGVTRSWTRLSDFPFTFHFHALEKEMATHSSVLAWRIPGTGEPGGLASMGSHRVGYDWSDLAKATMVPRP